MKSLLFLQQVVVQEMGDWCCVCTTRDQKTIASRFEHEGLAFLAITLPSFCRDFERALDRGFAGHDLWKSFNSRAGLPRFLGGFLDLVFDRGSGVLLRTPSITAIRAIRRITLLNGKVQVPCSDARTQTAMKGYVKIDEEVKEWDEARTVDQYRQFKRMSLLLWGDVFEGVEHDIQEGRIYPRHGPGATADKLTGNRKFEQQEWPERLDRVFPSGEFLLPNWRYFERNVFDVLQPGRERPVKVTPVPKSLKTPRLIAIEPTCMQYMQQGLNRSIRGAIERSDCARLFCDVLDQTPNQRLAEQGSKDGTLATLDLSEASDRVSNLLVREMVSYWPQLNEALQVTRSLNADVPGEGVILLSKFASMGSALCFPVEMMVFLTIVFMGIEQGQCTPLTKKGIRSFNGQVRVYGDDIIVPTCYALDVMHSLEAFGLKVNMNKSFWTGKFRESCGKEYYDGVDVTVVRAKRYIPTSLEHGNNQAIISTVAMRNLFFEAGMHSTVEWLDKRIKRVIPFPFVLSTSRVLGRLGFEGFDSQRQCKRLHIPLVKGYVVAPIIPKSNLEDVGALLKCLSRQGRKPSIDGHLERAGRPVAVDIKLRWAPPY